MVPDSLWLSVEFNNILVASERCCGAELKLRRFTSMASYVSNICAFDGNLHFLIRKVCLATMLQMLMGRARDKSLCQTHSNDFVMSSERKASGEGFRLEINQKIWCFEGFPRTGRCTELIYSLEQPADRYFFLTHKIYEKNRKFCNKLSIHAVCMQMEYSLP